MKNKSDFTVLMSVYYKEKPEYLNEALNSIFNQTLLPNQVVIVEDGPLTDELDKILLILIIMNMLIFLKKLKFLKVQNL